MQPTLSQCQVTCNGESLSAPPRAPGVYRLFAVDDALLYVGKSIDIASRLRSHFQDARDPGRQQRMMRGVSRIDCELTAGETGALLVDNAAIKAEKPLYNRRQKRHRKLWTLRLIESIDGFLTLAPSDFSPGGERHESVYGLFRSRHHIDSSMRSLARDERLCLRMLGMERGSGPCFQYQIGRCAGACAGREGAGEHNQRLLRLLERQRIAAWPFDGPVLLHEQRTGSGSPGQPRRQFHLLNHWTYHGSYAVQRSARSAAGRTQALRFDRDAYRIALAALRRGRCEVLHAASGATLRNPLLATSA